MADLKSITWKTVQESITKALFLGASDKKEYVDKKPTGNMEATCMDVQLRNLGERQILFPYRKGFSDELLKKFEYGVPINILEHFVLEDIKISIYKDALSIKFYATEKTISRKDA